MADNLLYYGDNLDVLRRHIKDESQEARVIELDFAAPPLRRVAEPEAAGYPRTPPKAKKPRKRS